MARRGHGRAQRKWLIVRVELKVVEQLDTWTRPISGGSRAEVKQKRSR